MEVSIQSRGYTADSDYYWQESSPPYAKRLMDAIDRSSRSLVFARASGNWILLVAGVVDPKQKDFRGRSIRHTLCWRCEEKNSHETKQMRALAIAFLEGKLDQEVSEWIQSEAEGFSFAKEPLRQLPFLDLGANPAAQAPVEAQKKIGKNCPRLQEKLAEELAGGFPPSPENPDWQYLVVVTGNKSVAALQETAAWRILSNLVPYEEWQPYEVLPEVPSLGGFSSKAGMVTVLLAVGSAVLVVLLQG
ncbi:MAG: hypothetical protein ACUVSQ_08025 [Pseudanabaenaceae cyanobacterium]